MRKKLYLILTIIGFIVPNIFAVKAAIANDSFLLWLDPVSIFNQIVINWVATTFVLDLLIVVIVFFIWSYFESRRYQIRNLGIIWVLTILFGLAFTFPLYLYLREGKKDVIRRASSTPTEEAEED